MGKERVKALIAKHRMKLNQKVEEALAAGKSGWLKQPNYESSEQMPRTKKRRVADFTKMDENSIQILREDLTKEFQSLV